jgi:hypothetical protein
VEDTVFAAGIVRHAEVRMHKRGHRPGLPKKKFAVAACIDDSTLRVRCPRRKREWASHCQSVITLDY